ncbi:hypothetical protein K469DRAFT_691873 [Zopfia rhizophila CBS 207.26]|uniref:Uncharacterized protein n=1 Tax=Zopfia rhizophila CBS 207.26 TaxID=1314779 RepID=A0A6A6DRX4_9PEZI|nr:hypothetical protein K469DRAFT_691873 [Zopfia rhizophila CBS 207.26]
MRLLKVLNEGKLEVPRWVTRLERELKKERDAENRKLKKAAKDVTSVSSSSGFSMIERLGFKSLTNAVVSSQETPQSNKRKRDETNDAKLTASNNQAKQSKTDASTDSAKTPSRSTPKNSVLERKPSQAEKSTSSTKKNNASRPVSAPFPDAYRVSYPDVELDWLGYSTEGFRLAFSECGEQWWSRFKRGNFQGILIIERVPTKANKTTDIPFKWRGRRLDNAEDAEGTGRVRHILSKASYLGSSIKNPAASRPR